MTRKSRARATAAYKWVLRLGGLAGVSAEAYQNIVDGHPVDSTLLMVFAAMMTSPNVLALLAAQSENEPPHHDREDPSDGVPL